MEERESCRGRGHSHGGGPEGNECGGSVNAPALVTFPPRALSMEEKLRGGITFLPKKNHD